MIQYRVLSYHCDLSMQDFPKMIRGAEVDILVEVSVAVKLKLESDAVN